MNSPWKVARSVGLATLFVFAAACEDAVIEPPGPDAASLAEGTGLAEPSGDPEHRMDQIGIAARFEGYANPVTGEFDVWMVNREEWEVALVLDDGAFRRTGQALDDYCEAPVSNGVLDSVTLNTVTNSIALDDACPSGLDGFTAAVPYSAVNGAYCANVRMRSNFEDPIRTVYAEITEISDGNFAMYNYAFKTALGLGNGAPAPTTTGNRTPVDTNGGLVRYEDYEFRGQEHEEWWIFQRPGDADFFFRGWIMYSVVEVVNGEDDDCDGLIDEDTSSYPDGTECNTDLDCEGGVCDCSGFPCGPGDTPTCRTPICGDALVEGVEECDAGGGGIDDAVCDFDCTEAICGDNYVNAAANEDCDPGIVGGFTPSCDDDCTPAECQDGVLNTIAGEICDDGNADNTDACLATCNPAYCGDGFTRAGLTMGQPGYEQCDDENTANDDACINCLEAFCGDGWVRTGEEDCDGNGLGTGGETAACDIDCTPAFCGDTLTNVTAGETCDEGADTATCDVDCTTPVCGDAHVNVNYSVPGGRGVEQCDLGSGINADDNSCTSDCRDAFCGDGFHRQDITNPADPEFEACDNGASNSDSAPDACRTDCTAASCGDAVIDSGEACDNGVFNSDTEPGACRLDCAWFSCGDGVTDPDNPLLPGDQSEQCDNGLANSDTAPDACRTNCTFPICGDGVNDSADACDDGNTSNNDDCLVGCIVPTCGDGFVWNQGSGTETCDDGDAVGGDGCSASCTVEPGWSCATPGADCQPICGDGLVRGDEECDDGNTTSLDGCTSTCDIENGWTCPPGEPSSCNTTCGDGIAVTPALGGTELCDTITDTSGCDAGVCNFPACGDNYLNTAAGEFCDDGNTSNNDSCLGNCLATATCGDGYVRTGVEECDGNGIGTGGETSSCNGPGAGSNACKTAECGDGYVNTSYSPPGNPGTETCDNGLSNSDTAPNACRSTCRLAYCGDGVTDSGEQCDQGGLNSDTIANRCRRTIGGGCVNPFCGDGVVDSGEQCDGSAGVSGSQSCVSCVIDNDGDGYLSIANGGTDCNDNNASIHPGASEGGAIFDAVDANCDGYNFSVTDETIRIVQPTACAGSLLGDRCYQQTATSSGLADAIADAYAESGTSGRVLVRGFVEIPQPVKLYNGVDVYGGWQNNWAAHNSSFRTNIDHYSNANAQYQVVFYGHALSSTTELRYLNVRMLAGETPTTDAVSLHGISVGQSGGFRLTNSTVFVDDAFDGSETNHGDISYPTDSGAAHGGGGSGPYGDCNRPGFSCTPGWNGGQGNGWQLWCPSSSHEAYFYRGNSALDGGGAGGSAIGVVLGRSPGAVISNNTITVGDGGAGGSVSGRGGQGGNSVAVWFHDNFPSGWSVSSSEGNPEDCNGTTSSSVGNNTITIGSGGSGGAGTYYGRGRPGFAGRCHLQTELYEWYYDCAYEGITDLRSDSSVGAMSSQLAYKGHCS